MSNDNVRRSSPRAGRAVAAYAVSLLATGAAWDVAGSFHALPPWWPTVSYVCVAAGSAAALIALLIRIFTAPRAARAPRRTLLQLVSLGVVVGAWGLRGDAEIPTDPPLVYAQLVGVIVYLLARTVPTTELDAT
jgi:hypothetical protein